MAIELTVLLLAAALVLVQLALAGPVRLLTAGLAWSFGSRDGPAPPEPLWVERAARAHRNMLETFPVFAAAALVAVVADVTSPLTALGSQIYLGARIAYVPAYIFHVTALRSLIWTVATLGLLMVLCSAIWGAFS